MLDIEVSDDTSGHAGILYGTGTGCPEFLTNFENSKNKQNQQIIKIKSLLKTGLACAAEPKGHGCSKLLDGRFEIY